MSTPDEYLGELLIENTTESTVLEDESTISNILEDRAGHLEDTIESFLVKIRKENHPDSYLYVVMGFDGGKGFFIKAVYKGKRISLQDSIKIMEDSFDE